MALDRHDEELLRGHVEALAGTVGGPAERTAEALAGFLDVLDGRVAEGLDRVRRVVDGGERGQPAAPGEQGLLVRVLVEACARAGDPRAGLAAADRVARTGNGAQPWAAEIRRLRATFLDALDAPPARGRGRVAARGRGRGGAGRGAFAARAKRSPRNAPRNAWGTAGGPVRRPHVDARNDDR